jgi:hypothetical protein
VYPLFFLEKNTKMAKKAKQRLPFADAQRKTVSSEKCVKHYFISTDLDLMRAVTTAPRAQVSSTNAVKHYFIVTITDAMPLDGSRRAGAPARQRTADRQPAAGVMPTAVSLR